MSFFLRHAPPQHHPETDEPLGAIFGNTPRIISQGCFIN